MNNLWKLNRNPLGGVKGVDSTTLRLALLASPSCNGTTWNLDPVNDVGNEHLAFHSTVELLFLDFDRIIHYPTWLEGRIYNYHSASCYKLISLELTTVPTVFISFLGSCLPETFAGSSSSCQSCGYKLLRNGWHCRWPTLLPACLATCTTFTIRNMNIIRMITTSSSC